MNFYAEFLAALDLIEEFRARPASALFIADSARQSYRVRKGETLTAIVRRFRTTPQQIMVLNNMKDPHRLLAGRVIALP
jgi:LysM repeat protein